ncbi:hypothetical protein TrLO_g13775 [Triparma laevis f. longispina]|uniref:DNA mismatch repair proteins mutS family domain-containing protein n=2 Tax=Triparma laevis TaxID=1534972 RepID=A0A9W7A571_9STRA|nr:hypothetical protein TrLO_g13775 [Triparma laevis f. longispina]
MSVQLDSIAIAAINLLPPTVAHQRSSNDSVFSVLNKTVTVTGKKLLMEWCAKPLTDLSKIQARQDIVASFVEDDEALSSLRVGLKSVCGDVQRVLDKIKKKGTLKEMYDLYVFVRGVKTVSELLSLDTLASYKSSLTSCTEQCEQMLNLCETVIDMKLAPRDFVVNDSFSEELAELKEEMDKTTEEIQDEYAEAQNLWSSETGAKLSDVRLEQDKNGGYYLRIPDSNAEKKLRNIGEFRVCSILKNGVHFETKALKRLSEGYGGNLRDYKKAQAGVVNNAMEILATYLDVISEACTAIGSLDCLQSLSQAAVMSGAGYTRPTLTDLDEGGKIEIENARHPCVELTTSNYIPNDYDLTPDSSKFTIITGPNMGGKSTYIRGLGSIVAMAQIGSFVPADSCTINIVDSILCRVGAGDKQNEGISTFMAEMCEASDILKKATNRSLIIIDELGRGTSTFDGYGLAWAISEYIAKEVKSFTLFATHFHELTRMDRTIPSVTNLHVSAMKDGEELVFLYKVEKGVCGQSFGIQVAEIASVPEKVIREAKRKAKELEGDGRSALKKFRDFERNIVEGEHFLEVVKGVF